MPPAADAGPDGRSEASAKSGWRVPRLLRSLTLRLVVLAVGFVAVPLALFQQFRGIESDKQALFVDTIGEKGTLIGRALMPVLAGADSASYASLGRSLEPFAVGAISLKLLFRPAAPGAQGGFYYVASVPAASGEALFAERKFLSDAGILGRLGDSCDGNLPFARRIELPEGRSELLTSMTPVRTVKGCWVLIVSSGLDAEAVRSLGLPFWKLPEVRLAAAAYLIVAVIAVALLASLWRSLIRFRRGAEAVRRSASRARFADNATIPELAPVAQAFDRMVDSLRQSAVDIRRAGEDTAHAFKTPLGVIRQALVPLSEALKPDDARARAAIELIEAAADKLSGLIAAARRLDHVTADILDPPRERVDLSALCAGMAASYAATANSQGKEIGFEIAPGVAVTGGAELIETAIENVLDNALSFAPRASAVHLTLAADAGRALIRVDDRGPGIDPADLGRLFERNYTKRPAAPALNDRERRDGEFGSEESAHFGLGLWIVRRNIEAMDGRVWAENRPGGGLRMTLEIPLGRAAGRRLDRQARNDDG